MNYNENCEGDGDAETLEAQKLISDAVLEHEDATGQAGKHIVIPADLEIQSVVMLMCQYNGLTYELSRTANTLYCT